MNDYPGGMSNSDTQHDGMTAMRTAWRFFVDDSGGWSWEQLDPDKVVVQRSERSFAEYDECVADAKQHGYSFEASQASAPRSMSLRRRS